MPSGAGVGHAKPQIAGEGDGQSTLRRAQSAPILPRPARSLGRTSPRRADGGNVTVSSRSGDRVSSTHRSKVAAHAETAPGERRVALDPDGTKRLNAAGVEVLVEAGAGSAAWFDDAAYAEAGATVLDRACLAQADLVCRSVRPADDLLHCLRAGQAYLGMLAPLTNPELIRALAEPGRHRDQPGRPAPHPDPGPVHGRAQLAGQRRRLQGGAGGRRALRPVLPDADDGGRHRPSPPRCWCSAPAWPACRRSAPPAGSARWSAATTCGRPPARRSSRSARSSSS